MFDRPALRELQRRHGIVMIQAQLARRVPEVHWLRGPPPANLEDLVAATVVRRPAGWLLHGDHDITVNGVAVDPHASIPLEDGGVIGVTGRETVFVARDLDTRYRALIGA